MQNKGRHPADFFLSCSDYLTSLGQWVAIAHPIRKLAEQNLRHKPRVERLCRQTADDSLKPEEWTTTLTLLGEGAGSAWVDP